MRRVRAGQSYRQVSAVMGVGLSTVSRWVKHAGAERLDRVDWSDRSRSPKHQAGQTTAPIVAAIYQARAWLRDHDALGEYGPVAIRQHLLARGIAAPCERTIARWVSKAQPLPHVPARPRPPRGWYLPLVASGQAELDLVDVVEGLHLAGKGKVEVLNALSLWESMPGSHPARRITSREVIRWLAAHWRRNGCPDFAQFDNDTIFSGAHPQRRYLGRVVHWCLCVGVIPVFTPPLEMGFQAKIEAYNRDWQERVWQRWHHRSLRALRHRSHAYTDAYTRRKRKDCGLRKPWCRPTRQRRANTIILLRRVDERGRLRLCAQSFNVGGQWAERLVRCEVDVDAQLVRIYRLSRRDPHHQTHLAKRKIHLHLVPWWTTTR